MSLERSKFPSLDGTYSGSTLKEKKEKEQMQDLLWSDPQVKLS